MDKQELKKTLLENMVYFAENFQDNLFVIRPEKFFMEVLSFKPTLSDRLIFNKIVEKYIDNIYEEFNQKNCQSGIKFIAYQLLAKEYFMDYDWWNKKELQELKKE